MDFPRQGVLLGVDYGSKRVGLSVSDASQTIAQALLIHPRSSPEKDAITFREVVQKENVAGIVVGLPVHMSGDEGGKANEAKRWGGWLAKATSLPVIYWDERYSSQIAEEILIEAGVRKDKIKEKLDMVAAQVMLQSYLDSGRGST